MRAVVLVLAVALAGAQAAVAPRAGGSQATADKNSQLPPLSYVCPMPGDEDVIEDHPGVCRKCGMELVPIRLVSVWTCPGQPGMAVQDGPGRCPVDGRPLVQMTMSLAWSCPGSKTESQRPGSCPDGSPMKAVYALRAHGNHNPQHGGQFFMAPDNWHHLEGSYFAPGTFRLYLYDDFTRPLPLKQVRGTQARLILTKDKREFPLKQNGRFLEAKVGKLPFPAEMEARVKFQPAAPEHLFNFAFESFSKDVVLAAPTTTSAAPNPGATPPRAPTASVAAPMAASPTPPMTSGVNAGIDPAFVTTPIPDTVPEMIAELRARNDQIKGLIDRGQFAAVYVPAFQAKDLALALDAHRSELPSDRQKIVEPAVNRLVRDAYLLDAFGDLGNKQQIVEAYARFAVAVSDIESAFPKVP